jgi:hypothetical protein
VGNFAGDTSEGYKSDVNGCILLGDSFGLYNSQTILYNSQNTFTSLGNSITKNEVQPKYTLIITNNTNTQMVA